MELKDRILQYIYLKGVRIDNEVINHYNYMESINPHAYDYLESIILDVRRDTFWEIANDFFTLSHEM